MVQTHVLRGKVLVILKTEENISKLIIIRRGAAVRSCFQEVLNLFLVNIEALLVTSFPGNIDGCFITSLNDKLFTTFLFFEGGGAYLTIKYRK